MAGIGVGRRGDSVGLGYSISPIPRQRAARTPGGVVAGTSLRPVDQAVCLVACRRARMDVVSPTQMTRPSEVIMFFISASDGDIYRSELTGSADSKIAELGSTNHWRDHLELRGQDQRRPK